MARLDVACAMMVTNDTCPDGGGGTLVDCHRHQRPRWGLDLPATV